MPKTSIEWTDHSWPVVNGCRRISDGCQNCYAERLAATRLRKTEKYRGLAVFKKHGPQWTGETRLWTKDLAMPLRLRKPARIFVADMGDLFYEGVSNETIAAVFGVMAAAPQHTFQVLTKRARRMREWFAWLEATSAARTLGARSRLSFLALCAEVAGEQVPITVDFMQRSGRDEWPLPNVWLGISAEDQPRADERIPELLATPAAMRFVSYEPALGPVDFTNLTFDADTSIDALRRHGGGERPRVLLHDALDWIIVGGESGPGARPFKVEWVESVIAQCKRARTACFIKQLGGHVITNGIQPAGDWWPKQSTETEEPSGGFRKRLVDKKGGDMTEWRPSLRVRQFPDAQRAT